LNPQGARIEDVAQGMMLMSERKAAEQRSLQAQGARAASAVQRVARNLQVINHETNAPFVADLRLMGALP
jgi:hypothetical protein